MFFRRLTGTSQSKDKKSRRHVQMPANFDESEESLEYIHPADLAASRDPLQRSLPSLKRYSRDPGETFASSSSRNKISAYPTLQPSIETPKFLPDIPPEPQQEETPDYVEEDFMPLRHKESDPQFPGAFELDPHPTSPAAAATADPVEEVEVVEAVEDTELIVEDVEVKSFVEHSKDNPPEAEEEREKLPAEEDLPPPVPDKQEEPTPEPVADYVEEKRKPRRPRNPAGFGSFLDNIVDLQAAGQFNPIVIQPVEQSPAPVSSPPDPPFIDITPPTPAPDVPQKSPRLPPTPIDDEAFKPQLSTPLRQSFTRHNPLPTPAQSPPPTPRSIFGVDPGTASRIAELARRRRLEASGELQHPRAQSEQSSNPPTSSTFPATGLPTPDADEFGHRRGRTDVHSSSSRRQHEPPSHDPASNRRRQPAKLTKQQSDEQQPPLTPDSLPSPSHLIPSPTHADLEREKQAQKALQEMLDRTLAELSAVKADNERLALRQKREKERLVEAMRLQLDDNEKLAAENKSLTQSILKLKTELKDVTSSLKSLKKEKDGWQGQLDAMKNQVVSTDKRIRCLDTVTRQQFETRQNVLGTQIKRRGKMANTSPAAELVTAVKTLNEEILQTSSILVEQMERDPLDSSVGRPRAQKVLGPQLTDILEGKKHQRMTGANALMLQVVLEIFIVNWCSSIIDAYYPNTKSFSDLLIELSAKPPTSSYTSRASPTCGKYLSVVQTHRSDTSPVNFPEWVKDIISDLTLILSIGGHRVKSSYQATLTSRFTALVKSAYEIRTALAEHDICGYLETVVVTPSMPFQHKWMIEAHSDTRSGSSITPPSPGHADIVLGTCGIGLQQSLPPAATSTSTEPTIVSVLKPQVVLSRVIIAPPSA